MPDARIVALAGGVGAARFLQGLADVIPRERLFVIGNVGDDAEIHGLHVSPDLDTVMYTLAGLNDPKRGWGIRGDTFRCLEFLSMIGVETWFGLGDRDLAIHLYRTGRLREGAKLSEVTAELCAALLVDSALVPATDQRLRTLVETPAGMLEFQDWFVRRGARGHVRSLRLEGAARARPAPGVLEAIAGAAAVLVCPSNPFISIGPILAVRGLREALRRTGAPVAAISPIVGGRALKGPAARMMKDLGHAATAAGVAGLYRDFVNVFVLDQKDRRLAPEIEKMEMRAVVTNTIMRGAARRRELAQAVLEALGIA
ncbi:MAG: 2-phospho-L-lactate transferase [Bryobacterales bacterium]|nr:2-phospho-L-lactate transferase [Bryobacterales bacterium]